MRKLGLMLAVGVIAAGCGGSSGIATDPGSGTGTLLVEADADFEGGNTSIDVEVRKGGVDVTNAIVTIESDLGNATLVNTGGRNYRGTQAGWPKDGFVLHVEVRDAGGDVIDELDASLASPVRVEVVEPDLTVAFDPHTLPNGVLVLEWAGPAAQSARVKSKDFDPATFTPDPLSVQIPAATFKETVQELEITRTNSTILAGGAPGSTFRASYKFKGSFIVTNPF